MVYIDGVKYACERCIRGHRVTGCNHTNMPLTMIKPKGRPATQCSHCREARKNKALHTRCKCSAGAAGKHAASCPCHVDKDLCTCSKNKTASSRRSASSSKIHLSAAVAAAAAAGSPTSTPSSSTSTPASSQSSSFCCSQQSQSQPISIPMASQQALPPSSSPPRSALSKAALAASAGGSPGGLSSSPTSAAASSAAAGFAGVRKSSSLPKHHSSASASHHHHHHHHLTVNTKHSSRSLSRNAEALALTPTSPILKASGGSSASLVTMANGGILAGAPSANNNTDISNSNGSTSNSSSSSSSSSSRRSRRTTTAPSNTSPSISAINTSSRSSGLLAAKLGSSVLSSPCDGPHQLSSPSPSEDSPPMFNFNASLPITSSSSQTTATKDVPLFFNLMGSQPSQQDLYGSASVAAAANNNTPSNTSALTTAAPSALDGSGTTISTGDLLNSLDTLPLFANSPAFRPSVNSASILNSSNTPDQFSALSANNNLLSSSSASLAQDLGFSGSYVSLPGFVTAANTDGYVSDVDPPLQFSYASSLSSSAGVPANNTTRRSLGSKRGASRTASSSSNKLDNEILEPLRASSRNTHRAYSKVGEVVVKPEPMDDWTLLSPNDDYELLQGSGSGRAGLLDLVENSGCGGSSPTTSLLASRLGATTIDSSTDLPKLAQHAAAQQQYSSPANFELSPGPDSPAAGLPLYPILTSNRPPKEVDLATILGDKQQQQLALRKNRYTTSAAALSANANLNSATGNTAPDNLSSSSTLSTPVTPEQLDIMVAEPQTLQPTDVFSFPFDADVVMGGANGPSAGLIGSSSTSASNPAAAAAAAANSTYTFKQGNNGGFQSALLEPSAAGNVAAGAPFNAFTSYEGSLSPLFQTDDMEYESYGGNASGDANGMLMTGSGSGTAFGTGSFLSTAGGAGVSGAYNDMFPLGQNV